MPRQIAQYHGELAQKRALFIAPMGPGFTESFVVNIDRLDVLGSLFGDPGPDYYEFIVFDVAGLEIGRKRVEGY